MGRRITFKDICSHLAARQCYNSGQSVKRIAKSANVSTSTVYKWLKNTRCMRATA